MGSKLVRAIGSGGSNASARFVGQGVIDHQVLRTVVGVFIGYDPLAQTFALPAPRIATGVDLVFTGIGSDLVKNHVNVEIRDVENGIPTGRVFGKGQIDYDQIHVKPIPGSSNPPLTSSGWNIRGYPSYSYGNIYKTFLRVYNSPSWYGPGRSFLRFNIPSPQFDGATITSAKLVMKTTAVWGGWQFPVKVSATGDTPWHSANHGWNYWDFPEDMIVANAQDPVKVCAAPGGWTEFDVKHIVQQWANGGPNNGFCIHAPTELNSGGIVQFANVDNRDKPQLYIEWVKNPVSATPVDGRWTRCLFEEPIYLEGERSYAMVVLTDDNQHSVGIATLGQKVLPGNGTPGYVTEQPIIGGVLLSSSNAETWTPHQNSDLTFRLLGANFTSGARDINLGTFTAAQLTDLVIQATSFRPDAATTVRFKVTKTSDNSVIYLEEGQPHAFTSRQSNESFNVVAELRGNTTMSPYLFPGTLVVSGNLFDSADYVTRAIDASPNFNFTCNLEVATPGSSTLSVFVESHVQVAGIDQYHPNGEPVTEWLPVSIDPLTAPRNLGDGRFERVYKRSNVKGVGNFRTTRCKLVLSGGPDKRLFVDSLAVFTKLP
jgi:hypothetical protein